MDKELIRRCLELIEHAVASNMPADSLEKIVACNITRIEEELDKPDNILPESIQTRIELERNSPR